MIRIAGIVKKVLKSRFCLIAGSFGLFREEIYIKLPQMRQSLKSQIFNMPLSFSLMLKKILCLIGLHKWSKTKFWTSASSNVRDYSKYCINCRKIKKWNEAK